MTDDERDALRRRAMQRLLRRHGDTAAMSSSDLAAMVEELEVYQAELEVQNEELRRTQLELADIRDRYRDLYHFAPVGYVCADPDLLVRQVNLALTKMSGQVCDNLLGARVEKLFHRADRDRCFQVLRRAAAEQTEQTCELRLNRPAGQPDVWVAATVSMQAPDDPDQSNGYRIALTDITARKQAENALAKSNEHLEQLVAERTADLARRAEQLRALAGELTLVEQRERRRMSKVLHDHLQQLLVAAKFRLSILSRAGDELFREGCGEINHLLDETISTSRSLAVELSPPILHEADLEAGLAWLARWMSQKHSLAVNLASDADIPPLPDDVKVLMFESVRELLFNAVKHARVSRARVNCRLIEGRELQVTVSDDGRGFDPADVRRAAVGEDRGFGLFSIGERLELIGGRFEIDTAPGQGCRCTLTVPTSPPGK